VYTGAFRGPEYAPSAKWSGHSSLFPSGRGLCDPGGGQGGVARACPPALEGSLTFQPGDMLLTWPLSGKEHCPLRRISGQTEREKPLETSHPAEIRADEMLALWLSLAFQLSVDNMSPWAFRILKLKAVANKKHPVILLVDIPLRSLTQCFPRALSTRSCENTRNKVTEKWFSLYTLWFLLTNSLKCSLISYQILPLISCFKTAHDCRSYTWCMTLYDFENHNACVMKDTHKMHFAYGFYGKCSISSRMHEAMEQK